VAIDTKAKRMAARRSHLVLPDGGIEVFDRVTIAHLYPLTVVVVLTSSCGSIEVYQIDGFISIGSIDGNVSIDSINGLIGVSEC